MSRLRRTPPLRIVGLAVVGGGAGRLMPPLIERYGGVVPRVSWWTAVLLLAGAVGLGVLAWHTWKNLHRDRRQFSSAYGVRVVAIAKAGIVAGALVAGFYAGFAGAYLDAWQVELGRERVVRGGAAAVAAALLVLAAWLLERACVVPGDDDDPRAQKTSRSSPEPA